MVTRSPAQSYEDLIVWQKGHALVLHIYKVTAAFPREELFGLVSQMRRAAVSVPANIAEAFKRRSRADKARIANLAQTSLEELRYYVRLSADLKYLKVTSEREQVGSGPSSRRVCARAPDSRLLTPLS